MCSFVAPLAFALLTFTWSATAQVDYDNPCKSYGIDFQDLRSYFQNVTSTDPFSFVSMFEGCQPDIAQNLLVDPNGDEVQCSDTQLTPDDTNQLSTCPITKNSLVSGDWSIIIISNNGDAEPIAYERDFVLSVGTPVTTTYTPTATLSVTETPVVNVTTTITSTESFTATNFVTKPAKTKSSTKTTTPARVTTTSTRTMGTYRATDYTVVPNVITRTQTQTCSVPHRQPWNDPWARFIPTLITAAALEPTAPASPPPPPPAPRRRDNFRRVSSDRAQRVADRKARLAAAHKVEKRDIDLATTTITDLNTDDYPTLTSSYTAAATTMQITSEVAVSTTSTTTSTVLTGTTTLPVVTITAPTPTKTKTRYTVYTTTVRTITARPKITVTVTTAPAFSTVICRAKGGVLV